MTGGNASRSAGTLRCAAMTYWLTWRCLRSGRVLAGAKCMLGWRGTLHRG